MSSCLAKSPCLLLKKYVTVMSSAAGIEKSLVPSYRRNCPEVFCKKGVHLIKPQACNVIIKETLAKAFFCKFCEISKNTFFYRTPLVADWCRIPFEIKNFLPDVIQLRARGFFKWCLFFDCAKIFHCCLRILEG